jgi:F-type H+-transporting ATPase subunit a
MLNISLAAEKIGSIGSFPITNSLLSTWAVMGILTLLAFFVGRSVTMIPSHLQSIAEIILSGLYDFFESVMGHHIKKAYPIIASLFLFIIVANWFGLLPGVGTIGFYEYEKESKTEIATETKPSEEQLPAHEVVEEAPPTHEQEGVLEQTETTETKEAVSEEKASHGEKIFVPLLRGATADLNTTIALAIIAFIAIQYFGFATLGFHYSKRFFNFSNPIMFFVGLLELVSDFSKVVSFAFRLFGNVFAGEVLLAVMAFLMPFIAPMPFLLLELFVGFIQALVFSTLTAVFINVAVAHEE